VRQTTAGEAFRGKVRDSVKPKRRSDRRIAEACQVGGTLVLNVRRECQLLSESSSPEPPKRIGADGKARSMPTPRESRGWTAPEVALNATPAPATRTGRDGKQWVVCFIS